MSHKLCGLLGRSRKSIDRPVIVILLYSIYIYIYIQMSDESTNKVEGANEAQEIAEEAIETAANTNNDDDDQAAREEDGTAETSTTAPKVQEPSSGTDDDEPSAQPVTIQASEKVEESKMNEEEEDGAVEQEKTMEEVHAAFVNEGLLRWEAARNAWLGDRGMDGSDGSGSSPRPTAIPLDVDKIIDVLFYASSREVRAGNGKPEKFPRNVPLPQMVDILQGKFHTLIFKIAEITTLCFTDNFIFLVTQIFGKPRV